MPQMAARRHPFFCNSGKPFSANRSPSAEVYVAQRDAESQQKDERDIQEMEVERTLREEAARSRRIQKDTQKYLAFTTLQGSLSTTASQTSIATAASSPAPISSANETNEQVTTGASDVSGTRSNTTDSSGNQDPSLEPTMTGTSSGAGASSPAVTPSSGTDSPATAGVSNVPEPSSGLASSCANQPGP